MNRNNTKKACVHCFETRQQFTGIIKLMSATTFFLHFPTSCSLHCQVQSGGRPQHSIFAFAPKVVHAPITLLEKKRQPKTKKPRKKPQQQQKEKYNSQGKHDVVYIIFLILYLCHLPCLMKYCFSTVISQWTASISCSPFVIRAAWPSTRGIWADPFT